MSKRLKVMCKQCRNVFTTISNKRFSCYTCQPKTKSQQVPRKKQKRKKWKSTIGMVVGSDFSIKTK